ncbi:hypothetical protein V8C42DRAFT_228533 [Trichoderma barbatum]
MRVEAGSEPRWDGKMGEADIIWPRVRPSKMRHKKRGYNKPVSRLVIEHTDLLRTTEIWKKKTKMGTSGMRIESRGSADDKSPSMAYKRGSFTSCARTSHLALGEVSLGITHSATSLVERLGYIISRLVPLSVRVVLLTCCLSLGGRFRNGPQHHDDCTLGGRRRACMPLKDRRLGWVRGRGTCKRKKSVCEITDRGGRVIPLGDCIIAREMNNIDYRRLLGNHCV